MPTRRNDALDAHLNAYFQIASAGRPIIVPVSMFDSSSVSFEIATEESPEEAVVESNEELDNFLKEFALRDRLI